MFPSLFSSSFPTLTKLIKNSNEFVVDCSIAILANTGHLMSEAVTPAVTKYVSECILLRPLKIVLMVVPFITFRSTRSELLSLCIDGTPRQAKQAVKAIDKIYGDKANAILQTLLNDITSHLTSSSSKKKEKQLNTLLKSLEYIAELAPEVFQTKQQEIFDFLMDLLGASVSRQRVGFWP